MGDVIKIVSNTTRVKAEMATLRETLASLSRRDLVITDAQGVDVTQREVINLTITLDLLDAALSSLPGMRRKSSMPTPDTF